MNASIEQARTSARFGAPTGSTAAAAMQRAKSVRIMRKYAEFLLSEIAGFSGVPSYIYF